MKFKKMILVSIIISIFMLGISLFLPNFRIDNDTLEVYSEYSPSVKVYNVFGDISKGLSINNYVNTNKVGKYKLECSVKFLFFNFKKIFTINIIDSESPIIDLNGDNPSYVCPNSEYEEEGYIASDNYDGDITDKIIREIDENSIWYTSYDSSGNSTKVERKIIYEDKEEPVITLKGKDIVTVYLGNNYYELGYAANDNCDGDITDKVISTGNVDTNKTGTYTINYEVSDTSGNKAQIKRSVIVKKKTSYYGNGEIYLTFDDGPSYLTKEILDILDEENVKVTFFVTSANDYTRRAYNSGHTIGLHTYTHDYSYVYSSIDNYFNDLNNISDKVYATIGVRSKIIRFPGGSSNTVSKNYKAGIMTYLTNEVLNRGYTYFDWNIDSNDAGSDIYNSTNIYYNVINNLSHNKTNVVLMHDSGSHTATVKALRDIIKYGKEYGYTFKAITEDTPIVIHKINN